MALGYGCGVAAFVVQRNRRSIMAIDTTPPQGPFQLTRVTARPISREEEQRWDELMRDVHPLGNAHFPGHSIKYVAEMRGHAVALLCFSACAYHLADRDRLHRMGRRTVHAATSLRCAEQPFSDSLEEETPQSCLPRVIGVCQAGQPGLAPALRVRAADAGELRGSGAFQWDLLQGGGLAAGGLNAWVPPRRP